MSRKILKNTPETDEEKIKRLGDEKLQLQLALAESIEKQAQDKIDLQLALAELIEKINPS
ncbi:hypothetical protein [Clostridium sp. JN-9]|uniref:hypothetical protein n=1 Tax=Clostridium sp. JN-9 TaxID=2507159 RepID=UPI000FFE0E52|nr:hypothetical protein [Clostridium sp. JN-9]QAT40819.1 hypothetical protein EQM05_11415 [Clostridium sp. JN-9]